MILHALILFAARVWHWEAEQAAMSWEGVSLAPENGGLWGSVTRAGGGKHWLTVSLTGTTSSVPRKQQKKRS